VGPAAPERAFATSCPVGGDPSEEGVEMSVTAVIRILCESNPSLGTTVVNGLLAWAGVLGASTAGQSRAPRRVRGPRRGAREGKHGE